MRLGGGRRRRDRGVRYKVNGDYDEASGKGNGAHGGWELCFSVVVLDKKIKGSRWGRF